MSMDFAANHADVIEQEHIREICPTEYDAFIDALNTHEVDITWFARDVMYDDTDAQYPDDVEVAYVRLTEAFHDKTGLYLALNYHDSECEGSRYDDVMGEFWTVGGVWEMTEAGKKLGDKIKRANYVTYG